MRVLLSVGVDANDQNLLQRGALLYCVGLSECGRLAELANFPHSDNPFSQDLELYLIGFPLVETGAGSRDRRVFRSTTKRDSCVITFAMLAAAGTAWNCQK